MTEYIKKEDIEQKIQDGLNNLVLGHDAIEVLGMIYDMPAADVAPVRHGRWVNEQMIVGGFAETWACDCSVCGRTQREPLWKPNYCPNCGAKMDLEEEQHELRRDL